MFQISQELDYDKDFVALQSLADADGSADILGGETHNENEARWTRIVQLVDGFSGRHADIRLFILAYRCDLALDGLCLGLRRLVEWLPQIEAVNNSVNDNDEAESGSANDQEAINIQVASLSYFCSDAHLNDLRRTMFSRDLPINNNELFRMAITGHTVASNSDVDKKAQSLQTMAGAWVRNQKELVATLRSAKATLRQLEIWLRHRNALGLDIRSGPTVAWLSHLEEIVIQLGAPLPLLKQSFESKNVGSEGGGENYVDSQSVHLDLSRLQIEHLKRDDIVRLLESSIHWFALHEPGNPSPYFLHRALRVMNANFLDIVRDILPEAIPHFEKLAGLGVNK